MYIFDIRPDEDPQHPTDYVVNYSPSNTEVPRTRRVDREIGRMIMAAFAQGRNEARQAITQALEHERIPH